MRSLFSRIKTSVMSPFIKIRRKYLIWKFNRAVRVLDAIDWHIKELGWNRTQRRNFWSEYRKSPAARMRVLIQVTER